MSSNIVLINHASELDSAAAHLAQHEILGFDLEGEFNLHRYGMHLCLLQFSDGERSFLIDPLSIENLAPVWSLLENPDIKKVSHGPQSDFVLLDRLFGCNPRNVFDTQRAAMFLAYENTSLSGLLERHFDVVKNSKIREKNWARRPIPEKMMTYASKDVAYMHILHGRMVEELKGRERYEWAEEENQLLETIRYVPKLNPHLQLKGANKLSRRETFILKNLYETREEIAEKLDKPAAFVIQNNHLVWLAVNPPRNIKEWRTLKQVHPQLFKFAGDFSEATRRGQEDKLPPDEPRVNTDPLEPSFSDCRKNRKQYERRKEALTRVREAMDELCDIASAVLSNKTIHRLACGIPLEKFRKWQQQVIHEAAIATGVDLETLLRESVTA